MVAEELVKAGRPAEALKALQDEVRSKASDAKLRVFLFQLLAITGQWERALTQLNVSGDLDAGNLLMVQVCQHGLASEALRLEIFGGQKLPLVLGEPPEWLAWLIQANQMTGTRQHAEGQALRQRAFDAAPVTPGSLNGQRFEWIADADQRLGPVLEAIIDGKYYWVPFANIRELTMEAPTDLRDLVWAPATITWVNGGKVIALLPARYPGIQPASDPALQLARRTDLVDAEGGLVIGQGQRQWITDASETPLLEVRNLQLDQTADIKTVVEG